MSGACRQTGRLFDPSLPRQSLEQFAGLTYMYGVGLSHFCPCVDGVSRKLYSTPVARGVTFF